MSWRKITFVVVALIVLLGGAAALSLLFVSLKPDPPRRPDMDMKRYVKVDTVTYSDVVSPLFRPGRVVSGSDVMLVAEASGKIEQGEVSLRKGASFNKGDLLAVIYKDEMELSLKARKSQFLTSIATMLPDVKIDYPNQYSRFVKFFDSINIEKDLPDLPEMEDEKLKIFLASRNVLNEYYGIKQDEKRLSRHSLYAPFKGTFTQVNYEVGAFVNTGGQIARMIRTDHLEVEVPVENDQSRWIKIGDEVKAYSEDRSIMYYGRVVRKSAFVEPQSQSRSIFVEINNSQAKELLAGEYYLVEFPGQTIERAMEIPRNAVFNSNEVFIVADGKLNKKLINVIKWNDETLIFNGLEEGAIVVTEPLINVKENSPVGIVGEEMPQERRSNRPNNTSRRG